MDGMKGSGQFTMVLPVLLACGGKGLRGVALFDFSRHPRPGVETFFGVGGKSDHTHIAGFAVA